MHLIQSFINKEWDRKSPLLLGYSGGPDSKALLYALLETSAAGAIHLAHIDHGWREESQREAEVLAQEAAELGVPFHTIRLAGMVSHNVEEAGRMARLQFFRNLFEKTPFQALLLGHHADDVAETALKRLLEGAHLSNLGGMTQISQVEGMTVWRPLLTLRKSELASRGGFDDATNRDPRFLRSRLRHEMLPMLTASFGKEVTASLACLSERAFELREYLDRKVAAIEVLKGPWGMAAKLEGVEKIEARHLLLKWAPISRPILEKMLEAKAGSFGPFVVYRGWAFIRAEQPPEFGEEVELRPGRFISGDWEIEVSEETENRRLTWQELWKGAFEVSLPDGVLRTAAYRLGEEYRVAQVPPFLRPSIPLFNKKVLFARHSGPRWRVRFFVGVNSSLSKRFGQVDEPS